MSKDMTAFVQLLEEADNFTLRQAVERLREGLFDPFGVSLLTARESQLNKVFDQGAQGLAKNKSTHLCVCGSYGQGKSHSLTYLRQRALEQGFVVSSINLDPREVPMHDFRQVYRALVSQISFPNSDDSLVEVWERWTKTKAKGDEKQLHGKKTDPLAVIPECIPHAFKAVLTALASDDMELSKRQKALKKHVTFRPREFPWILANGLNGNSPPLVRLRQALRYREVSFYKEQSLTCKGWKPYFDMVRGLGLMFQQMGYKGWVLLFDEAEAIAQTRINVRRTSYAILQRFFCPDAPLSGLYPVFAFTDDFFATVKGEDYDRLDTRGGKEQPYFAENYAKAWNRLKIYDLHDMSSREWQTLAEKLIHLHAKAYDWQPEPRQLQEQLAATLKETGSREARLKIKGLVNQLDFVHQEIVLG